MREAIEPVSVFESSSLHVMPDERVRITPCDSDNFN